MLRAKSGFIPTLLLTAVIAGCGGGGETANSAGGGENNNGGGSPSGTGPFFNDDAGIDFANTLGGRLVSLFGSSFDMLGQIGATAGKRQIQAEQTIPFNCSGGGSISNTLMTDDTTGELSALTLSFSDCVEGDDTTNGSITISGNAFGSADGSGAISAQINDLQVSGSDPVSMDGQVTAAVAVAGDETTTTISGTGISMTAEGETIIFNNYTLTGVQNETNGADSVSANATVISSIDGQVNMVIDPPFVRPDGSADEPVTGTLVMTHVDGSSLTLNADTGNPATFDYTISENGATTSGTANWADTDLGL